jgi:Flp pilus assembly protein TadB
MTEPLRQAPASTDDTPSLDPSAIEQNYRRERARRRARVEHRSATRRSSFRFYVLLVALLFLAAFVMVATWHEVETLFGI